MTLKLVTAPSTYPITTAAAKLHLRVDASDEDTLIDALITAATEMAEQHTGRAIMQQTWQLTLDEFPEYFELTRVPVQSITSITYVDTAGATQTLSNTQYALAQDDFGFARIDPTYDAVWPDTRLQPGAVTVIFVCGYASASVVPESIKQWIKLMVAAMYENREAEGKQLASLGFVDALLNRYKVYSA